MTWILGIVLIGIIIGIANKYPKTCAVLAFLLLIAYCRVEKLASPETHIPNVAVEYDNQSKNTTDHSNRFRNNTSTSSALELSTPKPLYIPQSNNVETIKKRVGAVCRDGSTSKATGRGACSHHGGVAYWLYE
mgnify:CR=1 FL=1|tara:strand:+ start:4563 stop:4961 length:399 start_codon:yes stop_codon:yes gene_type:complete